MFYGPSEEEYREEQIDNVGHTLARLGMEGWELISHSPTFAQFLQTRTDAESGKSLVVGATALPLSEIYWLKRKMNEAS